MARNNIYAGKPWLRWYDPEVPPRLEYPRLSYWDYARRAFEKLPEQNRIKSISVCKIPRLDELSVLG